MDRQEVFSFVQQFISDVVYNVYTHVSRKFCALYCFSLNHVDIYLNTCNDEGYHDI